MSWDQTYSVESIVALLERLTGKTAIELLEHEALMQGFRVIDIEDVLLDGGMYEEVHGKVVRLGDGRVFVPKLVERFTSDGNYGCDTYEYVLESETPEVKHTGDSEDLNEVKDHVEECEYGCLTDEYPLESDGELESEGSGC